MVSRVDLRRIRLDPLSKSLSDTDGPIAKPHSGSSGYQMWRRVQPGFDHDAGHVFLGHDDVAVDHSDSKSVHVVDVVGRPGKVGLRCRR